jgi:tRNA threonylcarbamoyladenosine biosynthesis protein TsaE
MSSRGSEYLSDETATEAFGTRLAAATRSDSGTLGGRITLQGTLGAGKTTLARGLLRGYGFQGAVKSPTYTLVEPYEFPELNIYHFDLYRLSQPEEVDFLGVAEYFEPHNLCLIEWPEHGGKFLPAADLQIELQDQGSGRQLAWQALSQHGERIAERLIESGRNP